MSDFVRISRADIEDSVTQAQYTICLQHFRDLKCPICQARKQYHQCFCKTCYFSLPENMRGPLWTEASSREGLAKFVSAYITAKSFLRSLGREVEE